MPLSTAVDLVNAALRKAGGARAIATIDGTTPGGAVAGDVYAAERDDLLRAYCWNFAVARADLSTTTAPTFEFTNAFGVPSDWLRTISVHDHTDPTSYVRYKMETVSVSSVFTRVIVTDASDIYLRYIRQVTDVALMTPCFQELLILRMARVFAVALAASNTLLGILDKEYQEALQRAKLTDEIEDYPDSISSSYWGATLINAAMQRVSTIKAADQDVIFPTGVIAARLLDQERDALLNSYTWNFAVARNEPTASGTAPLYEYTTAFPLPSDFLRLITVHDKTTKLAVKYKLETLSISATFKTVIITNSTNIYIRYVRQVSAVTYMPALFKQALIIKLAAAIAAAIPNGGNLAQLLDKEFQLVMAAAIAADEIEDYPEYLPAGHWGADIFNAALRKAGISHGADGGSKVPAGIIALDLIDQERDSLLNAYTWNFAVARNFPTVSGTAPVYEFARAFPLPADFLRLISVHDGTSKLAIKYKMETLSISSTFTAVVLTDATTIYVRYIRKVTSAALMTPMFRQVLMLRIAITLAATQGTANIIPVLEKEFQETIAAAMTADEIEDYPEYIPSLHWGADIFNAALRKAGASRGADAGGKIPAGIVALDLLDQERDALLNAYTWNFAVARNFPTISATAPAYEFASAFPVPSNFLRLVSVVDGTSKLAVRYKLENLTISATPTVCILTDSVTIYVRFVKKITDASLMTSMFKQALMLKLAATIALHIGNANVIPALEKELQETVVAAIASDEIEDFPEYLPSGHWAVDIFNAALRKAGVSRGADGGSKLSAKIIALDLADQERDALLNSYTWNFAVARNFPTISATAPTYGFTGAFPLPSNFLRLVSVVDGTSKLAVKYKLENLTISTTPTVVVLTDSTTIYIRYVRKITDASVMTSVFKQALMLKFAMTLALNGGNAQVLPLLEKEFQEVIASAKMADEIEDYPEYLPAGHWAVDIFNAALRKAGIVRGADAGSRVPAGIVALDLADQERDALLSSYTWNFAMARADLSTAGTPVYEWTSSFGLPSDFLRLVTVHDKATGLACKYKLETVSISSTFTKVLLVNVADIYIRYIRQVTSAALMTPLFKQALMLKLAGTLCAAGTDGKLCTLLNKEFEETINAAVVADEIEDYPEYIPAGHWAADIINSSLRKAGMVRGADAGSKVPAGIVVLDTLEQELDDLLRSHPWNFATARTKLDQMNVTPTYEWAYAYRLPSDWIRTVSVHETDVGGPEAPFKHESMWGTYLTTNGKFDSDTSWTKGTGWTISGGVATHASGSASDLSQSVSLTTSGVYRVMFTISGRTSGNITPKFTGGVTVTGTARNDNGVWTEELTALASNATLVLSASSGFDGSLDDVTLVRMDTGAIPAIVTDASDIYLRYVRRVRDATLMPGAFKNLLTLRMAKVLVASLPDGMTRMQLFDQEIRQALREAKATDGIEDNPDQFPVGSWVTSRYGSSSSWTIR